MSKALANPLQALLASAAKALPADTGEAARFAQRRPSDGPSVLLVDVSASMNEVANGGRRKREIVADTVDGLAGEGHLLYAFSAEVVRVERMPECKGSTALHKALSQVASDQPRHTLVVSDGQPDDPAAAIAAASLLTGTIDVLYVGPESDHAA